MKNIKIWTNTSVLNNYMEDLIFTDNKESAEVILLGSRHVELKEFPNLRAIFRAGVGRDNVPEKECKEKEILVEYPSEKTLLNLFEETANFTISMIMRMAYPKLDISLPWKKTNRNGLQNKTCLVIGLGNIGTRVANKLENLMNVKTFDLMQNDVSELDLLIKDADFVTLHIPNLPENKNFFSKERLNLLKQGSILINTARANLVNEDDLYEIISEGNIKAAFDVFWEEPYEGKLLEFYPDSFFMSPHVASSSIEFFTGCKSDLDDLIKKISVQP